MEESLVGYKFVENNIIAFNSFMISLLKHIKFIQFLIFFDSYFWLRVRNLCVVGLDGNLSFEWFYSFLMEDRLL